MKHLVGRRRAIAALVGLTVGAVTAGQVAAGPDPEPVVVQLLNVSDWHGQVDPISVTGVGNVGGAAVISSYWKADRLANPNTITFTAGDSFGGTPPLVNFFNEEPAVRTMRLMGFDLDGLGNHNWDKGNAHLQRMVDIANAPAGGSEPGTPFTYVSSNLSNPDVTGIAPWLILERGGVKIGFVGITNPEAPTLVFPGSFGEIVINDPVSSANKARAELLKRGARTTVLIAHMGVTGFDASGQPVGPLIDLARAVGGFDVIAGDHTDVQWAGTIDGKLVYENRSRGLTYAKASLSINPRTGKVVSKSVSFVTPTANGVTPDPAIVNYLAPLRTQLGAIFDTKIGVATARFPRGGSPSVERSGEAAIGNLAADAMRNAYGTQIAIANGGSLRQPLPSSYAPLAPGLDRADPAPYDLVIGDVFAVLPFGNSVVTRTLTGAQLWAAMENGVSQINPATCNGADGRFPQISGFRFTFSCSAPAGSRVTSMSLADGTPIPNDGTAFTAALPDFLNSGGDSYTMFVDGQGVTRDLHASVLLDYIEAQGTITPVIDGRITKQP